ncbi:MAG: TRAP transporter substrate-binding protein DctP [Deltaproteobacteria bacterium]|nr:TRAP transporter substrate-binding protein DctP [Deltaproteobacteria bacterium]MBW1931175.1 TRAP transporter substrate-binding protein DctP [Deltaproteobacteria bacterium]MBW2025915.1 TRAP transporter substrate-binding protein DctP [Deltaproteobacteria bacterium]MBW2125916.1 TRAP transporter substrate-binding protein DctP [Deltaproteobacteria bacterium]
MKGKYILLSFLFSAIFAMSNFFTFGVIEAKTLRYSTPYGKTNPMTSSMQWFGKEFEKRTNGQYKAKFYFSGQMGKAPDMPALCKTGAVDFIFTGMGYTPHIFKLNRGFELMYITENPHANGAALWELYHQYEPVRKEWEDAGLMMVFPAGIDIMACQSRTLIKGVQGIRGKKFRSYAGVAEMIKLWGGNPIALSYSEIYDALNRGVLDGAFGIPSLNVYASRFWEVAPYVFNTGAGIYAVTYFAISKRTYKSFPDDVKKIFQQLCKEGMKRHREWMVNTERNVFKKLRKKKSIRIINWSTEEKAKARDLAVPGIWKAWLDEMNQRNLPGEEFLNKYKTLVKKYEKIYPYQNPYAY